jgi:hypothetical protein
MGQWVNLGQVLMASLGRRLSRSLGTLAPVFLILAGQKVPDAAAPFLGVGVHATWAVATTQIGVASIGSVVGHC